MRTVLLAAIFLVCFAAGCGGGNSTPPPPTVTHLAVTGPTSGVEGAVLSFSVTALDASNAVVSSYAGTLHITSTDPKAQLPATLTLTNGTASFAVTLATLGNQTVTATDMLKSSITGVSNPVAITAPQPLAITSGAPPNGTFDVTYGQTGGGFTLSASGGVTPYSWSWAAAAGSSLPPGLSLSNGVISGVPGVVGTYNLVVTLKDSANPPSMQTPSYTIKINDPEPPVVNATPALPAGVVNMAYPGYTFGAALGLTPYSWSENGPLPGGMTFSAGGSLEGTPTIAGSFPIAVTVRDSLNQESAPQNFTILVLTRAVGFTATGSMSTPRSSHTATLLSDGKVLVVGGRNASASALATAELYSPNAKTFSETTGSMAVARAQHTATLLCDPNSQPCENPKVLVAGGADANGNVLTEAEIYDPSTGMFTATGTMHTARKGHTATLLKDGRVLVAGGGGRVGPLATAELYDPGTGSFTETTMGLNTERWYQAATRLGDGRALIAGGNSDISYGELFDLSTNAFAQTATGGSASTWLTATLLGDGRVLVAGGQVPCNIRIVCDRASFSVRATRLYDPETETFSVGADMSVSRAAHTATLLSEGRVLVAGGALVVPLRTNNGSVSTPQRSAELYDPPSGAFVQIPDMTTARAWYTATLLTDGTVLLIGGDNDAATQVEASAEIYK